MAGIWYPPAEAVLAGMVGRGAVIGALVLWFLRARGVKPLREAFGLVPPQAALRSIAWAIGGGPPRDLQRPFGDDVAPAEVGTYRRRTRNFTEK